MVATSSSLRSSVCVLAACAALMSSNAALAQEPSTAELLVRIQTLESEITELHGELVRLRGGPPPANPVVAQPAVSPAPLAAPSPPVTPIAGTAEAPAGPGWEGAFVGIGGGWADLHGKVPVQTGT